MTRNNKMQIEKNTKHIKLVKLTTMNKFCQARLSPEGTILKEIRSVSLRVSIQITNFILSF